MDFDIEKVNNLLKQDDFANKLKRDLSDEGIVKTFGDEGVSITTEDAQNFKQSAVKKYELLDNQLDVSGGKIGIEKGIHDVFEGAGTVIGGVAKGVASVAVGTGKGVGKSIWGIVQIPGSLARDIGKGIYEGIKDGITGRK